MAHKLCAPRGQSEKRRKHMAAKKAKKTSKRHKKLGKSKKLKGVKPLLSVRYSEVKID